MKNSILVVDDEIDFLDSVRRGLVSSGFNHLRLESNPVKAAALFEEGKVFDIALIDVTMTEMSGITLLEKIKHFSPNTECIMVTAMNEAKVAVECLRKGAYDYLVKPVSKEDLVSALKRGLERKRLLELLDLSKRDTLPELIHKEAFKPIITGSPKILKILKEAELHAESDVPILMTGESGTGKELLARAIHLASSRVKFPFTPVNMASVSGSLFDSEFFGHTKGAFTGATGDRMGYLEYTNRGILFLDEVGDLSIEFQGKLLRVLQDGEFIKLGRNVPQKADIRFIAATNKNLEQMVSRGSFRKDLYYRLKGAWLNLPPLRERMEDLPLLVSHFMEEFCGSAENPGVEEETMALLMGYDFPGNIRELRSLIQSALNLAQGRRISPAFLPTYLRNRKLISERVFLKKEVMLVLPLKDLEKNHILKVYEMTGKNKVNAAKILKIGINTLRRKLEFYGVE